MLFKKWKIWDFFNHIDTSLCGFPLSIIFCKDPLVLQEIKRFIFNSKPLGYTYLNYYASDLSESWWEDNLLTLNMFGNQDSFVISEGEKLDSKLFEILKRDDLLLEGRQIFIFFQDTTDLFNKLSKEKQIDTIHLDLPAPWESEKFLDFWAGRFQVTFKEETRQKILESLNADSYDYLNLIQVLKVNYPESVDITLEMLNKVIVPNRYNKFELAEKFSARDFPKFYKMLSELNLSDKDLQDFYRFIFSHLLKVLDPSYQNSKKSISKYDKTIMSHSRLWSETQIKNAMIYFLNQFSELRSNHLSREYEAQKKYLIF